MLQPEFEALNMRIKSAGTILSNYFGKQLKLEHKSSNADFRTRADVKKVTGKLPSIYNIYRGHFAISLDLWYIGASIAYCSLETGIFIDKYRYETGEGERCLGI